LVNSRFLNLIDTWYQGASLFVNNKVTYNKISSHKSKNSINNEDYIQQYKNEVTKCVLLPLVLKNFFSASSASEVSLMLVPVGGCRFEWQIVRAWTRRVQIRIGIRRHIHSVPLATQQQVKAKTVDSLLSSQI